MFSFNLANEKFFVRFMHTHAFNGHTACYIVPEHPEDQSDFYSGYAHVHKSDQFVKATGRKLALERALQKFTSDREVRKQVWNKYWSMTPIRKVK